MTLHSLTTCLKEVIMYKENGRTGRGDYKAEASHEGKEFICSACNKRKRVLRVEFGETVMCDCGNWMDERYER